MERNEVSIHEVKAYLALKAGGWMSSKELAKVAGIAERTARAHLLKLVRLGIADQMELFPAHRYRLSDKAGKRNVSYTQRLEAACEVFGLGSVTSL